MKSGAGDVQVVEPPDAIKTILVRWNKAKIDLTELARLRWIKKMSILEICREKGLGRSTIQVSIRTIRNCGISGLNFKDFERITVENAINEEIKKLTKQIQKSNKKSSSNDFRKKAL